MNELQNLVLANAAVVQARASMMEYRYVATDYNIGRGDGKHLHRLLLNLVNAAALLEAAKAVLGIPVDGGLDLSKKEE